MLQHEMKYLINSGQREFLLPILEEHLPIDRYGRSSVASLYYDTPDQRLIRASVEKPVFKEKIRLRSYGRATDTSPVFLEIKRKLSGVVYKRRVQTTVLQAEAFFRGDDTIGGNEQIVRELTYFRDYYGSLIPACLIVSERSAYVEPDGALRVTIDEAPRYRTDNLTLTGPLDGQPLLAEGESILEIKAQQAIPLWLASALSEGDMYRRGFSKYGAAYHQIISEKLPERIAFYV